MQNAFITFLASFLIWFMFGGLFVLWVIDGKIKREQVIHALVSFILAWVIAHIIKALFPTLRPFQASGLNPLTLIPLANGGFPSGHTAASFALATTVFLHDKKVGGGFLAAAAVVGIARVLGNVHYPIDIAAGAVLGILVSILIEKVHFRMRP